ncbi:hypothetical protein Tco_0640254 [Tanacetum coccineum]
MNKAGQDGPWHVLLYTLNSDTWRVLGNARLPRIGIRIKRSWGVAVVGSCIFWGCSKTIYNDDGSSYNLYMLVSFDLINHRFHVLDIPTQLRNDLPVPFYISKLGNSLVISGNHIDNDENRYICAWLLEVEAAVVTSWRVLFVMPSQNIAKLIGFTMDDDPIVVVDMGHEIVHTLQVYDRPSQQFHTLGIVGTSSTPIFSPTPSTPPNYYGGSSSNTECSNCKHLLGRIKVLQATLEMHMHPEQHTLDSTALLHDLNNDMEKLDGALMSTQKYMQKIIEDVGEDDDFNSRAWVSATNYVMEFGDTVTGCLGDIVNFLKKGKLDHIVTKVKSCSSNMFGDLNVTFKRLSANTEQYITKSWVRVVMERILL